MGAVDRKRSTSPSRPSLLCRGLDRIDSVYTALTERGAPPRSRHCDSGRWRGRAGPIRVRADRRGRRVGQAAEQVIAMRPYRMRRTASLREQARPPTPKTLIEKIAALPPPSASPRSRIWLILSAGASRSGADCRRARRLLLPSGAIPKTTPTMPYAVKAALIQLMSTTNAVVFAMNSLAIPVEAGTHRSAGT